MFGKDRKKTTRADIKQAHNNGFADPADINN